MMVSFFFKVVSFLYKKVSNKYVGITGFEHAAMGAEEEKAGMKHS